jgi:hypothetical protein
MKKGEHWKVPKGVQTLSPYTTSGIALGAPFGGRSGLAYIEGPAGDHSNWGTESWTNSTAKATPLSVTAYRALIVVASTKKPTVRVAH